MVNMFEKHGFPLKILNMLTPLLLFLEITDDSVSQSYLIVTSVWGS